MAIFPQLHVVYAQWTDVWSLNYWCGYWSVMYLLNCCVVIELTKTKNMINGLIISYDIRLVDVLVNDNNLKWKNLETSRSLVKATQMYKTLSMINLSLSKSPLQNSKIVAPTIILGILKLALPGPKTNFLKRSFSIVVQCVGTVFLTRQNCTIAFRI